MSVIIIPRKHLTQPQGRVDLSPEFSADYAYAPWMGASAVLGSDGPLFAQASMSAPLVSRGGVGTTYSASVESSGPTIDAYPFSLAAIVEVLPASGNVNSEAAVGLTKTAASSPACIGIASTFVGDAKPSFRIGAQRILGSNAHGRVSHIVGVAESETSRALYVDGALVGESSVSAPMFEAGSPTISMQAVRNNNFGTWITMATTVRLLGGGWFKRRLSRPEAEALSRSLWQLYRADPVRIYSLPTGPISWSSLTASSITQTGATLTLGGITR